MYRSIACSGLMLALAACDPSTGAPIGASGGGIAVPESVAAMAAPNQDLTSVQILPEDGCYWYRHAGPVETTLLPLRTVDGRPICTRAPA